MTKKIGRPKKATSEEKITIVTQYYISQSGEDGTALNHHGIYRKLSDYAKSLGYNLEAHDFSRDNAVIAHINTLTTTCAENAPSSPVIPTYEPLDITVLMLCSKATISSTLQDREQYFESLHKKAARAIESNILLSEKYRHLQDEVKTIKNQLSSVEQENKDLKARLRLSQKDVSYLRRIIRRDVEPERAQQFLQELTSPDAAVVAARDSVMRNINSLGQADQLLQKEANKEADMLDLSKLFTK